MKISVVCPVKNEVDFIGYSIMAAAPIVHEFIYTVASKSDDGTIDLLKHLEGKLGPEKIRVCVSEKYDFDPLNLVDYNRAFNDGIAMMTGEAAWFLHPDMIVTHWDPHLLKEGPLAWFTHVTSFAKDFETVILKGRTNRWKNIHVNKFGLHYYGGYGSQNEDFYHSDITGRSYKHYGDEFSKYAFEVADSGIHLNHYCELKGYKRRLEKMKLCLKTQHPTFSDEVIEELAAQHPRVTLEPSSQRFGRFEFGKATEPTPDVFSAFREEFARFKKEPVCA